MIKEQRVSLLGVLDRLLHETSDTRDVQQVVEKIAAERLWPGLRAAEDMTTYLKTVVGEPADLVVATLLVLLQRDAASLDHVAWRPVASELLATRIDGLRPHAARPAEKGSHAVFTACAGVVSAVEADFRAICQGFNDLRQTRNFRNAVQRRLNGGAASIVLRPFAPRSALDAPAAALFAAAESLEQANDSEADAAYDALMTAVGVCGAAVDEVGTSFARVALGTVTEAISRVATHRIELARPPAFVQVVPNLRPLPLLEPGVTCEVVFHLENNSSVGASQVAVELVVDDEETVIIGDAVRVESLRPRGAVPVAIPITILRGTQALELGVRVTWRNPDHSLGSQESRLTISAQAAGIDWEEIAVLQPFAPYPVERAADLIGRGQLLRTLERGFGSRPLGNVYVTGQRRVGKTSLVRVLLQQLQEVNKQLLVASVEMGEVRREHGSETVTALGVALARKLIEAGGASGMVDLPSFDGSLAPLNEVIEELRELDGRLACLLVIDEFDELPDEMFRRNGPGDTLFLAMRSLAQKPHIGWILVGGERMPYIRDEQATRLNTFRETKVDYLEFVEDAPRSDVGTGNFAALVRHPLPEGLTVADEAVSRVHAVTLGNPHFAKAVCAELYEDAVTRKDAFIQPRDVDGAVTGLAAKSDVELFAHFWEDGIFSNDQDDRRRVELERRHVLVAVAEALRVGTADVGRIEVASEKFGLTRATASRVLTDFLRRGVLSEQSGVIQARVPLFGAWLEDEGAYQLAPRGIAERAELEFRAADDAAAVGSGEISRLLRQWVGFKFRGESLSRESIVQWLEQFGPPVNQRLMLRLLERCRTINEAELLEGLRRLNRLISHEGVIALQRGQRTLTHMVVAGIGGPGASGGTIAYKYRQANNIRQRNVLPLDEVDSRLRQDDTVRAVVLVDDFIGSGKTATEAIQQIGNGGRADVQFYVFALSGIPDRLAALEQSPRAKELGVRVEVAHPLSSSQLPFTVDSPVFRTEDERTRAEKIARDYGARLQPRMPLGFGQHAALVAFPDNCPNNAPPILWSDANGWQPLFPRTPR